MKFLIFSGAVLASSLFGASLTHEYLFQGNLSDSFGGPVLTANGGTVNSASYSFGPNQGLTLAGAITNGADYSILVTFAFADTSGYRRILDFLNRTSDTGLYNANGHVRFYNASTGALSPFGDGVLSTLVVTRRSDTGLFAAYVDGVEQLSFTDSGPLAVISPNVVHFFLDDLVYAGEAAAGVVNHIQVYDGALTSTEVTALQIPEPSTTGCLVVLMFCVATRRRFPKPAA